MLAYRYPIIAREGWFWIGIVIITAALLQFLNDFISLPLWILALVLLFLFRDPFRKVPASPLAIVCPVDGRIVSVNKVHDGYLDREAVCVTILMGLTSVYSVHSPMEGKIIEQWLQAPRKIRAQEQGKSSSAPDIKTYAQWIQSDEKDDVILVMEASTLRPRPRCYAHSGERIGQGQRCGYLRFGTRVDVLVPESTRIEVKVGDKVRAGTDIIATLIHSAATQLQTQET
jgi:phosphatidylserine decarboxylase